MGDQITVETDTTDDAADTADAVAEATSDTAEAVADAVADAVAEATPDNGDAVDAVVIETELDLAQRVAVIEALLPDFATHAELDAVREAAWRAEDTAIEATQAAEEATTPTEVESMVEDTEVVTDENGETHLEAPADVPPPGSKQHWLFADKNELKSRVGGFFGGSK